MYMLMSASHVTEPFLLLFQAAYGQQAASQATAQYGAQQQVCVQPSTMACCAAFHVTDIMFGAITMWLPHCK
jgi:hypothetical protein